MQDFYKRFYILVPLVKYMNISSTTAAAVVEVGGAGAQDAQTSKRREWLSEKWK